MMTIWTMDQNMATGLNWMRWPMRTQVKKGVRIGDRSVETVVMVTDRARSPLLIKVMTLDAVPPGQVPTRTTPAVRAGPKSKAWQST